MISSTRNRHLENQIHQVQENVPYFGKIEYSVKTKVDHEARTLEYQTQPSFLLDRKLEFNSKI